MCKTFEIVFDFSLMSKLASDTNSLNKTFKFSMTVSVLVASKYDWMFSSDSSDSFLSFKFLVNSLFLISLEQFKVRKKTSFEFNV